MSSRNKQAPPERDAWLHDQVDSATTDVISEVLTTEDIVTGDAVVLDIGLASPLTRAAAIAIDYVVYTICYIAFVLFLTGWASISPSVASIIAMLVVPIVFFVIPLVIEIATNGRSLGKKIIGLRVVRDDAGPIRWRHSLPRHLLALLELWSSSGFIAFLTSLFNKRNKRVGDLLAGTVVVQDRHRTVQVWEAQCSSLTAQWARSADLDRIPVGLQNSLRVLLMRRLDPDPAVYEQRVGRILEQALPYVSPPPPAQATAVDVAGAILAERYRRDLDRATKRGNQAASLRSKLRATPFQL